MERYASWPQVGVGVYCCEMRQRRSSEGSFTGLPCDARPRRPLSSERDTVRLRRATRYNLTGGRWGRCVWIATFQWSTTGAGDDATEKRTGQLQAGSTVNGRLRRRTSNFSSCRRAAPWWRARTRRRWTAHRTRRGSFSSATCASNAPPPSSVAQCPVRPNTPR